MITIAVANQKGGVGKTTTAVTLAHGLALKEQVVLLVDLDPQGQCASHLGLEQEGCVFNLLVNQPAIRDVVRSARKNLWLLPGDRRTKAAESLMVVECAGTDHLADLLSASINGSRLDYLVLDTAPSAGGLQENALYACDLLLIPSAVDYLSLEGVAAVIQTLRDVKRPEPPEVRILPTFFDEVTRESKTNLARLAEAFGQVVLPPIHRAAALRECPAFGETIFERAPESRAADEYATIIWEVLDGWQ